MRPIWIELVAFKLFLILGAYLAYVNLKTPYSKNERTWSQHVIKVGMAAIIGTAIIHSFIAGKRCSDRVLI